MNIIFPSNLEFHKQIDDFYVKESTAAQAAGFEISTLSESHFGTPLSIYNKKSPSLYRGWIIKPQIYQEMCNLGVELLNNYDNYMWSYNFPSWYSSLSNKETPNSFVFSAEEIQEMGLKKIAESVSKHINCKSLIIKDYLKSRKHEWYDACFIRDTSDETELIRVMLNFFNLQGRDFYGGLVFRDFLDLKKIGFHPKSRMPLPLEFRTFFLNNKPIFTTPYWSNDVSYPDNIECPPMDWLQFIGSKIESPFVALDIAQDENNKWWVIEVNDGGSAGLGNNVDIEEFYKLLYKYL